MKTIDKKLSAWSLVIALLLMPLITVAQEEVQVKTQKNPEEEYLNKYLILAAENNPRLKALFNQYLAELEQIPQVGILPDPQLSFAYFIMPVHTRVGAQRATVSLSQMFPWFGTLEAQENVAAQRAKMKLQAFEEAKLALYKEIKVTFNELYYLEQEAEITEETLELLNSFEKIAITYFESGKSGFSTVLQVQMDKEELENRLKFVLDSREPLLTKFEQLTNTNLEEPVSLPDSLWEEELVQEKEEIFETILAKNPELEQLEHEIQLYESQQIVAKKMGLPSFTVGATYTNVSPRTDVEMAIPDNGQDILMLPQVGVRVPLYRKKYKAMQKEASLRKDATQYMQENLKNRLLTQLEQIYRDYLDAQRNVELYRRLSRLARQSLSLLQTEFATGKNDFEEIIRMERQLLKYQLELEKAKTARNNFVYNINYLMGK